MTFADFVALCRTLFRNEQGKAYAIEEGRMQEMFQVFDKNSVSARPASCYFFIAFAECPFSLARTATSTSRSSPSAGSSGSSR